MQKQEENFSFYGELNNMKKEIRLFALQAGRYDEPIVGTLHRASIYEKCRYEALSWCWGKGKNDSVIRIRVTTAYSEVMQIRSNLAVALRTLRHADMPRILWIDTICINQSQTSSASIEKEQQVQLMGEIFKAADTVLIWLGPEIGLLSRALKTFKILADIKTSDKEALLAILAAQERPRRFTDGSTTNGIRECTVIQWLVWVSQFPFWRRLWVIQEVALAESAAVICDHSCLPFEDLIRVYERIRQLEDELFKLDRNFYLSINKIEQSLGLFRDCRRQFSSGCYGRPYGQTSADEYDQRNERHDFRAFTMILTMCRGQLSTDPRDKIFGLLGLSSRVVRDSVAPRYGASPSEIFRNVAEVIIRKSKSLFVLGQVVTHPVHSINSYSITPSWVPCWIAQSSDVVEYEQAKYRLRQETLFDAGGPFEAEHVEFQDNCLTLNGLVIDVISNPSNPGRWLNGRCQSGRCQGIPNLDFLQIWQSYRSSIRESSVSRRFSFQPTSCKSRISPGEMKEYLSIQAGTPETIFWSTWAHDQEPTPDTNEFQHCRENFPLDCEIWRQDYLHYVQSGGNLQAWSARSIGFFHKKLWANTDIALYQSRFFVSEDGFLGLVKWNTLPGDIICVLAGARLPVVLRPSSLGSDRFKLVCECFVLGLMDGEATRDPRWSFFWRRRQETKSQKWQPDENVDAGWQKIVLNFR